MIISDLIVGDLIIGLFIISLLTGPIALIGVWLLGRPYRNREKDLRK